MNGGSVTLEEDAQSSEFNSFGRRDAAAIYAVFRGLRGRRGQRILMVGIAVRPSSSRRPWAASTSLRVIIPITRCGWLRQTSLSGSLASPNLSSRTFILSIIDKYSRHICRFGWSL